MLCRKCRKEIPDGSAYCNLCGWKQTRAKSHRSKRPNGTGSVYKLPGKRKKPWAVVISNGKKRTYGGYFETETEASINAARLSAETVPDRYNDTINTIFEAWNKVHYPTLSEWGKQGYESAWTYFTGIKSMKMRDVKTDVFQSVIDSALAKGKSRAVCEKIKHLSSQLCKYAMQQDLINKNYAEFIVLPKAEKSEKEIFTAEEIATLFAHKDDKRVKIILAMIYTGFRIDELFSLETANVHIKERYFVGGEKSEAGKNRIVPINEKVLPFVQEWYDKAIEKKYTYLIVNTQGNKMNVNNFRKREFYTALSDLGIQQEIDKDHPAKQFARLTPHSTRHTFASLAVKAGVSREALKRLMGHAHYSTTDEVYVHENMQQLKDGIAKM